MQISQSATKCRSPDETLSPLVGDRPESALPGRQCAASHLDPGDHARSKRSLGFGWPSLCTRGAQTPLCNRVAQTWASVQVLQSRANASDDGRVGCSQAQTKAE